MHTYKHFNYYMGDQTCYCELVLKFVLDNHLRCLADEAAVLLLYALVHGNSDFLEYVLVRTDLDTLVSSSSFRFVS